MALAPQIGGSTAAAPPGASRAGSLLRLAFDRVGPFLTLGSLLIAWELAARLELVMAFLLPPASGVAMRIFQDLFTGRLAYDIGITLYRAISAFSIAAIGGITLGILISRVAAIRWFFDPLLSIGLPMPKVALLPIFMLWFGLFDASKVLMAAFSASFQIVVTTWAATRGVERELVWSARSLGASEREILREVVFRAAMPQILTGLQIAMPVCMIVVLVTEMIMGGQGLGDSMLRSARYVDSPGVFAGIVEIGLIGFGVMKIMEVLRRRLLAWHQETQKDQ